VAKNALGDQSGQVYAVHKARWAERCGRQEEHLQKVCSELGCDLVDQRTDYSVDMVEGSDRDTRPAELSSNWLDSS
jgi:hypothetical protein